MHTCTHAHLVEGESLREPDGSLDLPTVNLVTTELLYVYILHTSCSQKPCPHLLPLTLVEVRVLQGNTDTRVKRRIEALDSVRGQE